MDTLVLPDPLAHKESLVLMALLGKQDPLVLLVPPGQVEHQDKLELLAQRVLPVMQVLLGLLDLMVNLALMVHKVSMVHKVLLDLLGMQVFRVPLGQTVRTELLVPLVRKDLLESAHQALQDTLVMQVLQGLRVLLERTVLLVLPVLLGQTVHLVHLALKGQLDPFQQPVSK